MKAKWHRIKTLSGRYDHHLYVGRVEWGISDHGEPITDLGLGRYYVVGPGINPARPEMVDSTDCRTLKQAKARCEDAALTLLQKMAADLGMKVAKP